MNTKEIQSFIDQTIYDFQTVEYSLGFSRIKETVLTMQQILTRIQSFQDQLKFAPAEYKKVFHESFWDKQFSQKLTMRDMSLKIKELIKQQNGISEEYLKGIQYKKFINDVNIWAYENIYQLRKIIKSPNQKRLEIALVVLSASAFALCLFSIAFCKFVLPYIKPKAEVLLFSTKDVISGSGWIQDVQKYNIHQWPTKTQLVVKNTKGLVSVKKQFLIAKRRKYIITIFHSSNNNNIQATVSISCLDYGKRGISTINPYFYFGKDVYNCEFPAGNNSIIISGMGSNKNSFLGVNSVVLRPKN